MTRSAVTVPRSLPRSAGERGQILAVFSVAIIVLASIVGLSIDAGSAYAQRRDQQTAADLASLAAANDYLINHSLIAAEDRARAVATANGYTNLVDGSDVDVDIDTSNGVEVTVGISAAHPNTFLRVVGMTSWTVSTTASALAGFPDTAYGASPFIFPIGAFQNDGTPLYQTSTDFGETNGDVPSTPLDFAWTNYGTGNVDTTEVSEIIDGSLVIDKTLEYGEYIGQHNNGFHGALFDQTDDYLSGKDLPVAVVDTAGNFMGWAMFHVNSASGGSAKHINGYFLSSFSSARLAVTDCSALDCPRYLGSYVLKLSD
jgi:Flp pilus assembly protein TadG